MAPAGAAAASCARPTVAACCHERTRTTDGVCLFGIIRSISQRWRFDCADVAYVSFLVLF